MSTEAGPQSRVDFSQFKNGDRVRVVFDGVWEEMQNRFGLRVDP